MTKEELEEKLVSMRQNVQSPLDLQIKMMGLVCETLVSCTSELSENAVSRDVYCEDIRRFHEKFDLAYTEGPRKLDPEMSAFRIKFLKEECTEYADAVKAGNLEKQFDALIDLVYVALGTAYLQGFPFRQGWRRVQAANMAKVIATSAADSTRGYSKDVVKPKGWKAPDLTDLVNPL